MFLLGLFFPTDQWPWDHLRRMFCLKCRILSSTLLIQNQGEAWQSSATWEIFENHYSILSFLQFLPSRVVVLNHSYVL